MVTDKGFNKFFLPSLIVIVLLALLVIAAPIDNSKIRSPASGLNFSSNNNASSVPAWQLFNVTFQNASDGNANSITNGTAVTFLVNGSWGTGGAVWFYLGNASVCSPYSGGALGAITNVSCSGYLNVSRLFNGTLLSDGYYTVNASVWNGSTATLPLNTVKAGNLTTYIIDNTDPGTASFQTLTSGNNFSTYILGGNLNITLNAVDNLANVSNVVVFLVNSTGSLAGNVTLYATQAGSTPTWFASLNVSHVPDGTYNLTLLVNDTAGNFNRTANGTTYSAQAILRNMIIDNTLPVATATCSPATVDVGDAFPCSCSGSDALSGVNNTAASSTAPEGTSTPQSSGTFDYTCTIVDRVGLSKSSVATYTVQEGGSAGSSSGGSSGGGTTGSVVAGTTTPAGSSGTSDPATESSTGSVGSATGAGNTGQSQESGSSSTLGGLSMSWIIAIIVIAAIVIGIVVMVNRRR
ncbi:MAG: hypothetical protein ACP5NS_02260 [Candidatus Pacearchaeota archaeon]